MEGIDGDGGLSWEINELIKQKVDISRITKA